MDPSIDYFEKIIGEIECHSVVGIKECFSKGVNPNDQFRGEPLIYELTSEYGRGPAFKQCVKAFVDHRLEFKDEILLSVLLDDPRSLHSYLNNDHYAVKREYTLRCAYMAL